MLRIMESPYVKIYEEKAGIEPIKKIKHPPKDSILTKNPAINNSLHARKETH